MRNNFFSIIKTVFILFSVLAIGIFIGGTDFDFFEKIEEKIEEIEQKKDYESFLEHEKAVISVVENNISAVVSIVASRHIEYIDFSFTDFFFLEPELREKIEEEKGSGFVIREDGLILTNKHVVRDENAEYTVFLSTGEKFEGRVLAKDPVYDLAILKIDAESLLKVNIGDSDTIRLGQTAIAIGNALGELQNTVSMGVISGTGRRVIARGGRTTEVLEDVLQTDAAINIGNSGGPLLNLKGEVIGVNTATVLFAEGVGFAIPINKARRLIVAVEEGKEVAYPFLGVRYVNINENLQDLYDLSVSYGALVVSSKEVAVLPGSAAEKAGIKEGDIILEINGEKITVKNNLARIINKYNPGDEVRMKVLRNGKKIEMIAVLDKTH
jgi:serine protease Do